MTDPQNDSSAMPSAESALPEMASLQKELAAQQESYLRLAAEFDNFRKRTRRESELKAGAEKLAFIKELLPAFDNLERALNIGRGSSHKQLHKGVEITLLQVDTLLRNHGIEPMDDVGKRFDPNWHEALSVKNDPAQSDSIILDVIQRGYRLGDKLFRPAKVIVNDRNHHSSMGDARAS